jgi:hypothetical protein
MKKIGKIMIGSLSLAALASPTSAAQTTIPLNYVFSGTAPAAASPWLSLILQDINPTTVRLTMDATGLSNQEFVSAWYVNFNPSLSATGLNFSIIQNPTQLTVVDIGKGTNAFKADGDGFFDILFDFPPPPGSFAAKFTDGEKVIVDVSRAGGLSIADFLYQSVNGPANNNAYFTAAHVQGIGNDSGWVGARTAVIPEPSTYALCAGGLVLGYILVRRRKVPVAQA